MSKFKNRKVMITGGLGMIGSTLAHHLVDLGAEVLIVDALLPNYGGNRFNLSGIESQVRVNICDIRDDAAMNILVQGQHYIFDLAAQVAHNDSLTRPYLDLDINCRGHLVVLEACRMFNTEARIIYPGSRLQYGLIQTCPVKEDHPQIPLSLYGVHKHTGEMYCLAYHRHWGLKTTILRISNPYGPRSQMKHAKYSMVNWFIRQALEGQALKVYGDGRQIRDYIFVDDLVRGMLAAAACDQAVGEAYNLGSGVALAFGDMVDTVVDEVGHGRAQRVPWPREYENVETGDFVADIGKLQGHTGWAPEVDLREGVRRTCAYYRKHGMHYYTPGSP